MTFDPPPPPPDSDAPLPDEAGPRPDPGNSQAAMLSWLLALLLVGAIVFLNQFKPAPPPSPSAPVVAAGAEAPPDFFTLYAKAMVKLKAGGLAPDDDSRRQLLNNIDQSAITPADRLRSVLAAAEVGGTAEGESRLERLGNDPELPEEIKDQLPLFRKTISGEKPALTAEEREELVERHGWFGRLALSRGLADDDPARKPLIDGAWKLLGLGITGMIVGFIAVVGGIGCCIAMIVMVATGKVKARFDPPAPGGSVYLEMLPVFAAAFLGVKIGLSSIISVMYGTASTPDWMILASLGLQWMLVAIIAWPRLRGVPWSRARMDLGWHSGRGVLREMAAGLFGYFAALPLLFLAMAVTVVYMLIRNAMRASRGEPPAQPDNAILEIITKAGTAELVLVFLLATVWAPLVEETIFRGGVYRHLRSRVPMLVAAVISAIAFGVMHGYEFLMLLPVMTLGFSFALIREWRGSLVGSMFVHGLHNATVMCFLLAAMSILRD